MITKSYINQEIEKLNAPKGSYIIVGDGILEALNIRKSADIDLVVDAKYLDFFKDKNKLTNSFDISTDWFNKIVAELLPDASYINSIPYLSLADVIKYKKIFNRDKDLKDLKLIEDFMANPAYRHSAGGIIIDNSRDDNILTIDWTTRTYTCFPKGGLEKNETSQQAAIREVKEETGYDTNISRKLGTWFQIFDENGITKYKEVDYYLLELANNNPPQPNRENDEHFVNKWLSADEAMSKLTFDDSKEALKLALQL